MLFHDAILIILHLSVAKTLPAVARAIGGKDKEMPKRVESKRALIKHNYV